METSVLQLLVSGGVDSNDNTLSDLWILDVKSVEWREVSSTLDTCMHANLQPQLFVC